MKGKCIDCMISGECKKNIGYMFGFCGYGFVPKPMTVEKLAEIVADDFCDTMRENGFATFDDMKRCYWWSNKDIKDEVNTIIDLYRNNDTYGTSGEYWLDDEQTDLYCNGEWITYQQFAARWHKIIRDNTRYWE